MAFLRLPASMLLLASFLLLLYGTTSSADQSHDPLAKRSHDLPLAKRSHDLPLAKRSHDLPLAKHSHDLPLAKHSHDLPFAKREMEDGDREKVAASLSLLSFMSQTDTVGKIFKNISNFGKLVPYLGVVFSSINLALAFVSQRNPVTDLEKGFAEVNRKLDALSRQVSDLSIDVEWFCQTSEYGQDTVRIRNAWKKYNAAVKNIKSKPSKEGKLLASFTDYYKDSGAVGSMDRLYHYLTVNETSLSGNLNDLVMSKFKCSVRKISQYNMYFNTILLRGMLLNQFYSKLNSENQDQTDKVREHEKMMDQVIIKQKAVLRRCLDKSEEYMKDDVTEKATSMGHTNKKAIAEEVKTFLDEKYFWYDWVVVVYDSSYKADHVFYDMTTLDAGTNKVTVGYIQRVEQDKKGEVNKMLDELDLTDCYHKNLDKRFMTRKPCVDIRKDLSECSVDGVPVKDFVMVPHISYDEYSYLQHFAHVPNPFRTIECLHWISAYGFQSYVSRMHVYYSKEGVDPCSENPCENQGKCERLFKSNEYLCECPSGWNGDRCEEKRNPDMSPDEIDRR